MKAACLENYSKTGTDLKLVEIDVPEPKADEVLIKVKTAGVNPLDNMIIRGEVKILVPYKTPLIMGNEFVGIIESIGSTVSEYRTGDRVYGRMPLDSIGAFAEYVCVPKQSISKVPDYLGDEEAACVPLTGLTAMQSYQLMDVKPGNKLFISGGTGSLGAMAIPIAKSLGLWVASSGNAKGEDRLRALGLDEFIDYKTQDPYQILNDMDYVLDSLGSPSLEREFTILRDGGTLVSLKGLPNREFAKRMGYPFLKRIMFSIAGLKYDRLAAKKNQRYYFEFVYADGRDLEIVSRIMEQQQIAPSVDGVFDLADVNAALRKVASGHSEGKTVLRIY